MKFSLLAALQIIVLATFGAINDENSSKWHFRFSVQPVMNRSEASKILSLSMAADLEHIVHNVPQRMHKLCGD